MFPAFRVERAAANVLKTSRPGRDISRLAIDWQVCAVATILQWSHSLREAVYRRTISLLCKPQHLVAAKRVEPEKSGCSPYRLGHHLW